VERDPQRPLCGIGLPPPMLEALAADWGMRGVDITDGELPIPGDSPPPVFILSPADGAGVRRALAADAVVVLEHPLTSRCRAVAWQAVGDGVRLCLRTDSVFSLDLAALTCDAMVRRGRMTEARRPEIEVAFHEAITNATVHGNLGIQSGPSDEPAGFQEFYRLVQERLADPDHAARRVTIDMAWEAGQFAVTVQDEGDGYAPPSDDMGRIGAKSGRGLKIIRELSESMIVEDGGRRLKLRFRA